MSSTLKLKSIAWAVSCRSSLHTQCTRYLCTTASKCSSRSISPELMSKLDFYQRNRHDLKSVRVISAQDVNSSLLYWDASHGTYKLSFMNGSSCQRDTGFCVSFITVIWLWLQSVQEKEVGARALLWAIEPVLFTKHDRLKNMNYRPENDMPPGFLKAFAEQTDEDALKPMLESICECHL